LAGHWVSARLAVTAKGREGGGLRAWNAEISRLRVGPRRLGQRPIVEWGERRRSLLLARVHGGDLGSRESKTVSWGVWEVASGMTVME